MPFERPAYVLQAPQAVMAHLRGRGARPDQLPRRPPESKPPRELSNQEIGLVEAALPPAIGMKRHRQHPLGPKAFDREPLSQQHREWARQPPPPVVFEALDRQLDRTFVRDRGTQASESFEATATPTLFLR